MSQKPRPIHRHVVKRTNGYRIPEQEALTPRLREQGRLASAIGFHHDFKEQEDEEPRDRR